MVREERGPRTRDILSELYQLLYFTTEITFCNVLPLLFISLLYISFEIVGLFRWPPLILIIGEQQREKNLFCCCCGTCSIESARFSTISSWANSQPQPLFSDHLLSIAFLI